MTAAHHLAPGAAPQNPAAILEHLRRAILMGDVEPGAWLRQTDLATHFGVSRTPVREALRALERESLVTIVPNHGARVTPLSLEDFEEIYALRAGIEGLAARRVAEVATADDIATLSDRLTGLRVLLSEGDVRPYLRAEWALRLTCYRLTRRDRLVATILHLRGLAERYLRHAFQDDADTRDSFEYHQELVAALARGDGAEAERINREALDWTLRRAWPFVRDRVNEATHELALRGAPT